MGIATPILAIIATFLLFAIRYGLFCVSSESLKQLSRPGKVHLVTAAR